MWVTIFLAVVLSSTTTYAADWNSCYNELDSLRRKSRDASEITGRLRDLHAEYETKKSNYESCKSYGYDRYYCQNKLDELNSCINSYNSELSNFQYGMESVRSKIRSVEDFCGYDLGILRANIFSNKSDNSFCTTLIDMSGIVEADNLIELCLQTKNEEYCNKCFSLVQQRK